MLTRLHNLRKLEIEAETRKKNGGKGEEFGRRMKQKKNYFGEQSHFLALRAAFFPVRQTWTGRFMRIENGVIGSEVIAAHMKLLYIEVCSVFSLAFFGRSKLFVRYPF